MLASRRTLIAGGLTLAAVVLLFLPEGSDSHVHARASAASKKPFRWQSEALFSQLEARFEEARHRGCGAVSPEIDRGLEALDASLAKVTIRRLAPEAPELATLEEKLFTTATLFGACPARVGELLTRVTRLRVAIKDQSEHWSLSSQSARDRLYRLL